MKTFSTAAALAALLSTAYALTVTLEETPCLQNNTDLETFTIDTDQLVVKEIKTVCGLKITSTTAPDIYAITCQAFRDTEGQESGSAIFTFAEPAEIATNPVEEGSIRCDTNGLNGTIYTTTVNGVPLLKTMPPTSAGTSAPSGAPTGAPANGTNPSATQTPPSQGQPQPTSSETPPPDNKAGNVMGMSALAVAAAFAVFAL